MLYIHKKTKKVIDINPITWRYVAESDRKNLIPYEQEIKDVPREYLRGGNLQPDNTQNIKGEAKYSGVVGIEGTSEVREKTDGGSADGVQSKRGRKAK